MKIVLIAMLAIACLARGSHADSVPTKARTLADRGRAAHDQRDYAGAIAAFTEAYAISPAPALLFNLAQAYRLAGRCDDASLMYHRFLATGPADDARSLAEMHLATVERCVHTHSLRVVADPVIAQVALPAAPDVTRLPVDERHPERNRKKLGAGLAIGGAAALLVAGYYALDAHNISSEIQGRYAQGEKWKQLEALNAQGDRSATIAKVAGVTGAIAAIAGATVLVLGHRAARQHHNKRRLDVSPVGHGAKVTLAWRF